MAIKHSVALVLETNNLRGGTKAGGAAALTRLLGHLKKQTYSLSDLVDLVITHDGADEETRARCEAVVERPIGWTKIEEATTYYQAKNRGFAATTADIVVFADGDCWPEETWLEQLLAPFDSPDVQIVAGRTRYRKGVLGEAVSLLDFLYLDKYANDGRRTTRNFYANNVAFRRAVFDANQYDEREPFFRGQCQSLALRLDKQRVPIVFQDAAVTIHRFPDTASELVKLRLFRGRDLRLLAPVLARHIGVPLPAAPAAMIAWLGRQAIAVKDLKSREPDQARRGIVGGVALGVAALDAAGILLGSWTKATVNSTMSYQSSGEQLT